MLAKQYIPLNFVFKTIPVIIYPAKDDGDLTKAFSKKDSASIEKYVFDTLSIFDDKIQGADLLLCYIWNDETMPMCDIWKVSRNTISDDSGFLYDCFIVRDNSIENGMGIASGNSLIVAVAEELLLRKLIMEENKTFLEASNRQKYFPTFPFGSEPLESFY